MARSRAIAGDLGGLGRDPRDERLARRRLGRQLRCRGHRLWARADQLRAHRERRGGDRVLAFDVTRQVEQRRADRLAAIGPRRVAGRGQPQRGRARTAAGRRAGEPRGRRGRLAAVRRDDGAHGLHRRAQLGIAHRLAEQLDRLDEIAGAAVEQRELEMGEQRGDVGRRAIEQLADRDPRDVVLAGGHQQVDAVVQRRVALARAGDRDLGLDQPRQLRDIAGGARDPAQAAQRGGGAAVGEQRGLVVAARALGLAQRLAQPAGLDPQRRARRVVGHRDLALVLAQELRGVLAGAHRLELLVGQHHHRRIVGRQLGVLGELDRARVESRLDPGEVEQLAEARLGQPRRRRRDDRADLVVGDLVAGREPRDVGVGGRFMHRPRAARPRELALLLL
ncbi:MAG: hypothetical protein E6J91_06215 [Deltaproteobacteria bacterium]|nr:MAG: hypothetical protein E6J91_06215 [Deltaproteobacteria bacterium]